jgi:hypothetical protein
MLLGGVTLYAREEIVDSGAFADRAVTAVHQPAIQRVITREITTRLVEPALPDILAARPLVQSAIATVVTSKPFAPVIRLAALHGHRLLFQRGGGNAVFDIADAGTVVSSALKRLAPKLADDLPKRVPAVLLTLRKRSFASQTLRIGDTLRVLGLVLPLVAAAMFALAIGIAPIRRRAVTRSALAVGVIGIAFAVAFELFRRYVVSHMLGDNGLKTADVRAAVDELWGTYLGGLMTWTLVVTALAWIVAAASAGVLRPYSARTTVARLRSAVSGRSLSQRERVLLSLLAIAFSLFMILRPTSALRVLVIVGGVAVLYVGVGELLSATATAEPPRRRYQLRSLVSAGGMAAVSAAAFGIAFALVGNRSTARAGPRAGCNGYVQLCARRLDEVAFAGTHNSMSAADAPGWLIANQDRTIAQQLDDGIRLFKISSHYGVASSTGRVYTDIKAAGGRLNRVAAKLDPAARLALQRVSRSVSGSSVGGKRDIYLCHSLCELGATRMVDFLSVMRRFLELNPDQVLILFDEDYVSERDLESVFKRAGLFRYLATLQLGQPLPTLGDLIRSHHNVVVFAQVTPTGRYPWNADGFSWIQDTPLGASKPGQFNCKLNRGYPSNPLLMMNNWADVFPPRLTPNLPLVKRAFIIQRARQCDAQRGMMPNLILTDFYNRGQVVGAAAELNGVGNERPSPIVPVSAP